MADPQKHQGAVELGSRGGKARARNMSKEDRSAQARLAVQARKDRRQPKTLKPESIPSLPDQVVTPKEEKEPEIKFYNPDGSLKLF